MVFIYEHFNSNGNNQNGIKKIFFKKQLDKLCYSSRVAFWVTSIAYKKIQYK